VVLFYLPAVYSYTLSQRVSCRIAGGTVEMDAQEALADAQTVLEYARQAIESAPL